MNLMGSPYSFSNLLNSASVSIAQASGNYQDVVAAQPDSGPRSYALVSRARAVSRADLWKEGLDPEPTSYLGPIVAGQSRDWTRLSDIPSYQAELRRQLRWRGVGSPRPKSDLTVDQSAKLT